MRIVFTLLALLFSSGIVMGAAPSAPTNFSATAPINQVKITLSWADNSSNETGFVIKRRPHGNGTWQAVTTTSSNQTSYNDQSVATGFSSYDYQITATNGDGSSTPVETVVNEPLPSTWFGNFIPTPEGIDVEYTAVNATTLWLRRGDTWDTINTSMSISPSGTSFFDSNNAFTDYWYTLSASNAWGSYDYPYISAINHYDASYFSTPPTVQFQSTSTLETDEGNWYNVQIDSDDPYHNYSFFVTVVATGTATYNSDYTILHGNSQVIRFGPYEYSKVVSIFVANDEVTENDETILLNLQSAINCTISGGQKQLTINDVSEPDSTAPTIILNDPIDESFVASTRPEISVDLFDAGSGINTTTLQVRIDGNIVTPDLTANGFEFEPVNDLSEGEHTIQVNIVDYAGNSKQESFSFSVDSTSPSILASIPSGTTEDYFPLIGVMYEDVGSGVDPTSVQILFNGNEAVADYVDENFLFFYPSGDLSDGQHTVSLSVNDQIGNTRTHSWNFTVNTTDPVLRITPNYGTLPVSWYGTVWQNRTDVTNLYSLEWDGGTPFGTQYGDEFTLQSNVQLGIYPVSLQATLNSNPNIPVLTASETARIGENENEETAAEPEAPNNDEVKPVSIAFINPELFNLQGYIGLKVSATINTQGAGKNIYVIREHAKNDELSPKGMFEDSGMPPLVVNEKYKAPLNVPPDVHALPKEGMEDLLNLAVPGGYFDNDAGGNPKKNEYTVDQFFSYKTSAESKTPIVVPNSGFRVNYKFVKVNDTTINFVITKTPAQPSQDIDNLARPGAGVGVAREKTIEFKKVNNQWKAQP